MQPNTLIGMSLSILAASMNALGMNVQRLAGVAKPGARLGPTVLNSLGIFLSTACAIPDVISFGYAPQSLLAPLGAATLVINLALAPLLHSEPLTVTDWCSTLVIVAGVALCVMGGNSEDRSYSLAELQTLASSRAFHALAAVVVALLFSLAAHVRRAEKRGRGADLSTGLAYPICAGLFGGCTVLSVKILGETLSHKPLNLWVTVPVGVAVNFFALSQIVINNRGLSQHSPKVLVPIFSSTFVVSNALGGGVFFNEFALLSTRQWQMYGGGCALIVGGVITIALQASQDPKDKKA